MYSPKINEDLIEKLYKLGKAKRKPMTKVVDGILREYFEGIQIIEQNPPYKIPLTPIYTIIKKK